MGSNHVKLIDEVRDSMVKFEAMTGLCIEAIVIHRHPDGSIQKIEINALMV